MTPKVLTEWQTSEYTESGASERPMSWVAAEEANNNMKTRGMRKTIEVALRSQSAATSGDASTPRSAPACAAAARRACRRRPRTGRSGPAASTRPRPPSSRPRPPRSPRGASACVQWVRLRVNLNKGGSSSRFEKLRSSAERRSMRLLDLNFSGVTSKQMTGCGCSRSFTC